MSTFFETLTESENFDELEKTYKSLQESNVVRMDKNTMKKRLMTQATLLAAKDANDPLYQKYVKVAKAKRKFRTAIQQKYASKGQQKVRDFIKAQQARR